MDYEVDYAYLLEMLDVESSEPGGQGNYSLEDFLRVTMDYQQEDHWFQRSEEMAFIILTVCSILLGLVGNGLVCFIIIRKGPRQSSRNWYILNLALSDILTCVLGQPLTLVRLVLKTWPLGGLMCRMVPALQTVYVFVSTLTLVALAVDRYRAIMCQGTQYPRLPRSPCYCIAVIWTLSLAISLPMFLVHKLQEVKGFGGNVLYTVCMEQWDSQTSLTVYTAFVLVLQYLSPLAAIVVLHVLIGNFLRMRIGAEVSTRVAPDPQWRRKRRRHRKNMCLLTSMAAAFAVAWLPLHVVNSLASFDMIIELSTFPLIHASCMLVAYSSVCLNPVIYGLLNSNFRRDLCRLWVGGGGRPDPCSSYCQYLRKSSRHTEQCGLLSVSPPEISTGVSVMRARDLISAV